MRNKVALSLLISSVTLGSGFVAGKSQSVTYIADRDEEYLLQRTYPTGNGELSAFTLNAFHGDGALKKCESAKIENWGTYCKRSD